MAKRWDVPVRISPAELQLIEQIAAQETGGDGEQMARVLMSEGFVRRCDDDMETVQSTWRRVENEFSEEQMGELYRELINEAIMARKAGTN